MPVPGSRLQLAIAAAALFVVAAVVGTLTALGRLDEVTPWHLVGGIASPLYTTAGMLLFPRLGALVSTGLFIAGQMLASMILDGVGAFGLPRQGLPVLAMIGAIVVIVGIVMVIQAQTCLAVAAVPRSPDAAHGRFRASGAGFAGRSPGCGVPPACGRCPGARADGGSATRSGSALVAGYVRQ